MSVGVEALYWRFRDTLKGSLNSQIRVCARVASRRVSGGGVAMWHWLAGMRKYMAQ
jgi:hypothetical protein